MDARSMALLTSFHTVSRWSTQRVEAGPGELRQEQEIITMRVSVEVRRGTIPGRSLTCLSSPLVLALASQAQAAVRRPGT